MTQAAPRAFISHASEDKERFVLPFAKALREAGIDAWVDKWEIGPGDSLVQRIFDEGIAEADAFIVVLSLASVSKPWVREELDAGVVRRITSGRAQRLIPVVLDEAVEVPEALRHLLWESVPKSGFDGVVTRIINVLHGRSERPVLGESPRYARSTLRWTSHPADETVFRLVVDELRAHDGPGWLLWSNDVQARALELGLSTSQFCESMHALIEQGLVSAEVMAGGVRWMLKPFKDSVWLRLEEERGLDIVSVERQALAAVLNDDKREFRSNDLGVGWFTLGAILRRLEAQRLINVTPVSGGFYAVTSVSPLAPRALRDSR